MMKAVGAAARTSGVTGCPNTGGGGFGRDWPAAGGMAGCDGGAFTGSVTGVKSMPTCAAGAPDGSGAGRVGRGPEGTGGGSCSVSTRTLGIALNGGWSGARPCTGTGERGEFDDARGKLCCCERMRLKLGERLKEPPMLVSGICVPGSAAVDDAAAEDRRGGGGCASSSVSVIVVTKRCSSSSAFSTAAYNLSSVSRASTAHGSVCSKASRPSTSAASCAVARIQPAKLCARAGVTILSREPRVAEEQTLCQA